MVNCSEGFGFRNPTVAMVDQGFIAARTVPLTTALMMIVSGHGFCVCEWPVDVTSMQENFIEFE
jgi:hypothetical protein